MKIRFFKDWLSFSHGERRGIIFLAALLLIVLLLPLLMRRSSTRREPAADVEHLHALAAKLGEATPLPQRGKPPVSAPTPPPAAFAFDPNTVSRDSLLLLGFSPKQAAAIAKYRERSGGFRASADFLTLHIITEAQRKRLLPLVFVASTHNEYARPAVVELNTADTALLCTLPGIGPYFAQKIVDYREALGGYVATEQLLEIAHFGDERLQGLAGRIAVDACKVQPFELCEENHERMRRHPYIGAYTAHGIAQYIRYKHKHYEGPATLDELAANNVVTSLQAHKLRPYVK